MCKVYTGVGGIKQLYHVYPPARQIIHSLKLVDYLHVQVDNPWYNYYLYIEGEPVSYTRWRAGEGGISWWGIKHEKCAALNGGHGWWWDDVLCGSANYVVCEAPAFQ